MYYIPEYDIPRMSPFSSACELCTLEEMSILNKHALSILKIAKEENIIEETL